MKFRHVTLLLMLVSLWSVAAIRQHVPGTTGYIVVLNNLPSAAAYEGGHLSFAATAPTGGARLDSGAPHVQLYASHLAASHSQVLASCGVALSRLLYSYQYTANGFAASLHPHEVQRLQGHPWVGRVVRDRRHYKDTTHTPEFLRLPQSLWRPAGGAAHAGDDVIIGVIDTGINSDHPSFSDQVGEPYSDIHLAKPWRGNCQLGGGAKKVKCNRKLIGARFFVEGLLAAGDSVDLTVDSYSARDVDGHGSHTASTAGGNSGVEVRLGEGGPSYGCMSGMAPRARIAAYKGLWASAAAPGQTYGTSVDLMAALDAAVSDGVDVINYSIGPNSDLFDPWVLAALHAGRAGVFVSASAGNSGPQPVTLGHVAPWYLAVAASTHDRVYEHKLELGSGATFFGQGISAAPAAAAAHGGRQQGRQDRREGFVSLLRSPTSSAGVGTGGPLAAAGEVVVTPAPLIEAASAAKEGHNASDAELCLPGVLDAAKVKGCIVICLRGSNGRVDKGKVVLEAGGVGMVLRNSEAGQGLITDVHFLPAAHVLFEDGLAISSYANATPQANASLSPQITQYGDEAPEIIDFSSRGPIDKPINGTSYASINDILKPDVAAPGVSIWAAFSPAGDPRRFSFYLQSGTSMASPHIAGIGALLKQAHPEWDPFMIKSAIQTTSTVLDNRGHVFPGTPPTAPGTPFDYGSGQVNPSNVSRPGLVFPSKFEDYVSFLYGIDYDQSLSAVGVPPPTSPFMQARELNLPNIAISRLRGTATVTRTLLSADNEEQLSPPYKATVIQPDGVEVVVEPSILQIKSGASSVTFSVTFKVLKPSTEFLFGHLIWDNGHHQVQSQLAVQPLGM